MKARWPIVALLAVVGVWLVLAAWPETDFTWPTRYPSTRYPTYKRVHSDLLVVKDLNKDMAYVMTHTNHLAAKFPADSFRTVSLSTGLSVVLDSADATHVYSDIRFRVENYSNVALIPYTFLPLKPTRYISS